jgi:hypothetical protein
MIVVSSFMIIQRGKRNNAVKLLEAGDALMAKEGNTAASNMYMRRLSSPGALRS